MPISLSEPKHRAPECAITPVRTMSVRTTETSQIAAVASPFWSDESRRPSSTWREFEQAVVATRGDLDALMLVLWAFEPTLAGRALRMGDAALELAASAGLGSAQSRLVRDAAWVHDLGRLAIPPDILAKPGLLTTDEMLIVQEHPALGAALLTQLPTLRHLSPIVIAVHERWDGDGYPRGLRGTAIPIESRILAIAEAYDALTTQRPYRPAMADAAAVAEVLRCAGAQFDPDLVRCWLRTHEPSAARVH